MEQWRKQLRRMPRGDRDRILVALQLLLARDVLTLDRKKLTGYENIFRIRVGNYRIIYHDDGNEITVKAIPRRDENTYKDF